ncbi:hypothetical protein DMR31_26860 [Klebsiella variicola]|uniref:hypothetical protein n=1 Tax=Klebsiella variicola TaxID=244366 RepID=UPI000D74378B|nr:hypothetical protein [Klebsiella variicola]PXK20122.1 hypothetical protein DMR31_26860 [Klebsiella variicola]
MSKSNLVAFRVPTELHGAFNQAVAAAGGGKQGIPPTPYNETAVIGIVADTIREGFDNGRIIAERLNEAGYQTKAGKAWDKDIYSAWKRQDNVKDKITLAITI